MSLVSINKKIQKLKDRSKQVKQARVFFEEKEILEVDCPILCQGLSVDEHIEIIQTTDGRYLHSSPEMGMKRLLSLGMPDIYQLSHVFRQGEEGARHNPEFTLVEWYRRGFTFKSMINETLDFIYLFVPQTTLTFYSYKELFEKFLAINPLACEQQVLQELLHKLKPDVYPIHSLDKDTLLSLLLDEHLVTFFDPNAFTVLYDYPSSQAALSQVEVLNDTEAVAKRFEIYHQSFELANGYQELRDFKTHEERFQRAKQKRDEQDKSLVQTDTFFMRDLQRNELPACCGVAVGFDRLMMLRHQVSNIKDILPFSWSEA